MTDTKCPKCGMMRLYQKVDSEPAKFCGGCGHSFANEEQAEQRIRELEAENKHMTELYGDAVSKVNLFCHNLEKAEAELARVREACLILLDSHGCRYSDEAEIPEEISAQFDIGLDDAKKIAAALEGKPFAAACESVGHELAAACKSGDYWGKRLDDLRAEEHSKPAPARPPRRAGQDQGGENMSDPNKIEVGDKVTVGWANDESITGIVLYVPCATGDSWHIKKTNADIYYVQVFEFILLVEKAKP